VNIARSTTQIALERLIAAAAIRLQLLTKRRSWLGQRLDGGTDVGHGGAGLIGRQPLRWGAGRIYQLTHNARY
jgi:hypothetical protein